MLVNKLGYNLFYYQKLNLDLTVIICSCSGASEEENDAGDLQNILQRNEELLNKNVLSFRLAVEEELVFTHLRKHEILANQLK